MTDRIERELLLLASPQAVWDAVTGAGWLADEVQLDLRPGGDACFRSGDSVRTGWVEAASAPHQLVFWWAADGERASRVQLTLRGDRGATPATRLTVVECRPLEVLDLVGLELPGAAGATFGPALMAA